VAAAYGWRRDALIDALKERGIEAYGRSGMNVWIPVPDETGAVAPGARFRMSAPPGIRITVSILTPDDIEPLADAIASAVRPAPVRGYA
jgi:DNA-binding transcriptional MocR family regulator